MISISNLIPIVLLLFSRFLPLASCFFILPPQVRVKFDDDDDDY